MMCEIVMKGEKRMSAVSEQRTEVEVEVEVEVEEVEGNECEEKREYVGEAVCVREKKKK